jgi:hypothetical protein
MTASLRQREFAWQTGTVAVKGKKTQSKGTSTTDPAEHGRYTLLSLRLLNSQIEAIEGIVEKERERTGYPISRNEMLRKMIIEGAKAMGFDDFPSHV